VPAAVAATPGALGIATMFSWLFTAGVGTYMLRSVVAHGGLRKQRDVREGLPPAVLFGHFGLAIAGLVVWISYLAIGWDALAWVAVCLLMPAIGLGLCTVILWTPYPRALTDDVLAARLIDEVIASLPDPSRRARKPRVYPSAIIPFGHGLGAVATFVLAVVTATAGR
jgi:manganese efflux pump family protein